MTIATVSMIIGGLFAVSEALSFIPAVKANGVFQVAWRALKLMTGAKRED